MPVDQSRYQSLSAELQARGAALVAVSKTKPVEDLRALYDLGQRDFGENYVQELVDKQAQLPLDIRWHFIGHLQSNKVKYIAPFVELIHGIDSVKLLKEVDKEARRHGRTIDVLLQVHIAAEETKFGFDPEELRGWALRPDAFAAWPNVRVRGLMGMASFSDDESVVRGEFRHLFNIYSELKVVHPGFDTLSMGMSGDYAWALDEGATIVRIGSLLFGRRS